MSEQTKKTILFIEDDTILSKMYKTKLTSAGYEVLTAFNGIDGLNLAKKQQVDLILLDIMLPRMSGTDLLGELRKSKEFNQDIPIIVITNLSQKDEQELARELKIKEYLVKADLTPNQLLQRIEKYI